MTGTTVFPDQTGPTGVPIPAEASRTRTPRLDSLTGLRFLAALAVFAFHSSLPELPLFSEPGLREGYYRVLSQAGGLGVTFFFVLSGFVITWSSRTDDPARSFYRRRFVKILPLYYLTAVVALVALHWGEPPWADLGAYLTLLQVWVPDYALNFSVLAPGWSLATESFFYLCFPFLIRVVLGRGSRRLWWTLGAVVATLALIPFVAQLLPAGAQRLSNEPGISGVQYWFDYVFPMTRIPDFAVGMVLAELLRRHRVPRVRLGFGLAALGLGYAVSLVTPVLLAQRFVLVVPCALIIVAGAQRDLAGDRSVWRSRPARRLGEWSFAFYLLHFVVLHVLNVYVLRGPTASVPAAVAYLLGAVAITVAGAAALHSWVEMPMVRAYGGRTVRGLRATPRADAPAGALER